MKIFFGFLLLFLCGRSYAQFNADGFFVQQNMYVDPYLLKTNQVDSFFIRFNEKDSINFYLDSTGKLYKKIFYSPTAIREYTFNIDGLSNYACHYLPKDKTVCQNNRIISFTGFKKKNSQNQFDSYGRLLLSVYKKNGTRYTEAVRYNTDGSVDKMISTIGTMELVYQYEYKGRKLIKITQTSNMQNADSKSENAASFIYYNCGLVKSREGYFLNSTLSLKCDFIYYSKGVELK